MKKRLLRTGALFAMLVTVVSLAAGCGKSSEDGNKEVQITPTTVPGEAPDVSSTEVPAVEEVEEQKDVAVTLTPVPTKAPVGSN